jgi:predicted DNA-binding transcriptional regulator YafY
MRNAEIIRQWQILKEIEARRAGVTIHELAGLVRVSTRTIRRDLQALQEAGFAVYDEGEANETKRWKLDDRAFQAVQEGLSIADIAALYVSRSLVEALPGWPLAEELKSAFKKLERALNPRTLEFLSTLPQVISTKAGPRADADSRLVETTRKLLDAIRDRHVLTMRYFSAASRRAKSYEVHPYRLALAQGGAYLVAWVPPYDEFRTFAVERIERLSVSDDTFRRTHELPADLFGASMGVFSGEPERVELEFDARMAPFIHGKLFHPSQTIETLPDGRRRMTLDVSIDWALRSWLLGFGAGVRVIAPVSFADSLLDELRQAEANYQNLSGQRAEGRGQK